MMLSALQHYLFCPRQCALIHVEKIWSDNFFTTAGNVMHSRVDKKGHEKRSGMHIATSLRLVSHTLGIMGVADKIEFYQCSSRVDASGIVAAVQLPKKRGWWTPFPVEYKHGKPKQVRADEVQLCAQALCLEEMLNVTIAKGALFYGETHHRVEVIFDKTLRDLTQSVVDAVHSLIESGVTPNANYSKACQACSLISACRPKDVSVSKSVCKWLRNALEEEGI